MLHTRVASLLLATLIVCTAATPRSDAGIINSDNGIVTSWEPDEGEKFYFYRGSFNDYADIINIFEKDTARDFADELLSDITEAIDPDQPLVRYTFVFSSTEFGPSATKMQRVLNFEHPFGSVWANNPEDGLAYDPDLSISKTGRIIYWASTTAPSSGAVPEPSTAIAMGLLGVVGFAGNRRRRRTALNA